MLQATTAASQVPVFLFIEIKNFYLFFKYQISNDQFAQIQNSLYTD